MHYFKCVFNRIFEESDLKEQARSRYAGRYVILGDEAYRLSDLLITSIRRDRADTAAKKLFNRLHKSTRVIIEHTFGVLKGTFRALLNEMRSTLPNVQMLIGKLRHTDLESILTNSLQPLR